MNKNIRAVNRPAITLAPVPRQFRVSRLRYFLEQSAVYQYWWRRIGYNGVNPIYKWRNR